MEGTYKSVTAESHCNPQIFRICVLTAASGTGHRSPLGWPGTSGQSSQSANWKGAQQELVKKKSPSLFELQHSLPHPGYLCAVTAGPSTG